VILIDVNLLLYATFEHATQHRAARAWLTEQLGGPARVALPWVSLLGFVRIATSSRIVRQPLTMTLAWQQVLEWLACEPAWIPQPTEHHAEVLGSLLAQPGMHSNLVPDAHLAALAIEHGLTLCSSDGDFARFRELNWLNPLST
jgi:toxin-antitoxin system PIN domain toxin